MKQYFQFLCLGPVFVKLCLVPSLLFPALQLCSISLPHGHCCGERTLTSPRTSPMSPRGSLGCRSWANFQWAPLVRSPLLLLLPRGPEFPITLSSHIPAPWPTANISCLPSLTLTSGAPYSLRTAPLLYHPSLRTQARILRDQKNPSKV